MTIRAASAARPLCAVLAGAALAGAAPAVARGDGAPVGAARAEEGPPAAIVAEALFLCDALPPGGRDASVSVAFAEGEPDPETGDAALAASPRVQLALALGERLGLTADVGLAREGELALDAPGASLKLLLRAPAPGRTGLAASLDLFGSMHSLVETEAGVGLGAIRAAGPVTLRAAASAATGVRRWSPHLHLGASAAIALGRRWRALAEVVADASGGEAVTSVGPALKVALGERTALACGALAPLSGRAAPTFVVQLSRGL